MPVAMADTWGLALGRPGAADVGDEQKPTLIDEREMGATSSGVFLSGANPPASTGRWRPHRARSRGARVSGNSIPTRSAPSKRGRGGTARRTLARSIRSLGPRSRARSDTRHEGHPGPATSRVGVSALSTGAAVGPAWACPPAPGSPLVGTPATSERTELTAAPTCRATTDRLRPDCSSCTA